MALTDAAIQAIISAHTALTDSDYLSLLKIVRDQVTAAAVSEHGTVEIEINQRRHRVTDPVVFLRFLDQMIDRYEEKVAAVTYGPARNYARLKQ
jgi:hypothetical protein